MAIPYPGEVFGPYVLEPIGGFMSYWGEAVIFPLAHWMGWAAIIFSLIMIVRNIWWNISTGGPENRAQAAIARWDADFEKNRQKEAALNPVGENRQRK